MSNSSSDNGCFVFIALAIILLIQHSNIKDNKEAIVKLEEHVLVYHTNDSDDWAESAHALGIDPDSMTMGQFKAIDTSHTGESIYMY